MTTKERQLLFKDLSARLPYECMLRVEGDWFGDEEREAYDCKLTPYSFMDLVVNHDCVVKPYLRPLSSMTDEEEILFRCELPTIAKTDAQLVAMRMELFLKGHLDFNHLIEKGLALEAPEDMYKNE